METKSEIHIELLCLFSSQEKEEMIELQLVSLIFFFMSTRSISCILTYLHLQYIATGKYE